MRAGSHRKPIREEIGQAQYEDNLGTEFSTSHSAYDSECGHNAVQTTIHQIAYVLVAGTSMLLHGGGNGFG
jgi:hypothetical protein